MAQAAEETASPLRVSVYEVAELVSYGLRAMLEAHSRRVAVVDLDIVLAGRAEVDLLLLDPEPTPGHAVSPRIFAELGAPIVLLTWPAVDVTRLAAIPGVVGHVPKSASAIELVSMLEAVLGSTDPRDASALSHREGQVLALIARGFTNVEIAKRMFVSINTVKTYIRCAYAKIGVETRSQAVAWTLRNYG